MGCVSLTTYETQTYELTMLVRHESSCHGLPPLGGTLTYELTHGCRDESGRHTTNEPTSQSANMVPIPLLLGGGGNAGRAFPFSLTDRVTS